MTTLKLHENCLGFEIHDGSQLVTLYRAREELPRTESPKPCFAPIYTPSGGLVTEYRPADHAWHTGLYYGWVHVNEANLWGGPWFFPDVGKYEYYPGTHGRQAHETFERISSDDEAIEVVERLTWRDGDDKVMATEIRTMQFSKLEDRPGSFWTLQSDISPEAANLKLGASRAARYSGLELRMGPEFSDVHHRTSEGIEQHEKVMKSRARWCIANGASGGAVIMLDHPSNPRHPAQWFTRRNLIGAAFLMEEDLEVPGDDTLRLRYGILLVDTDPGNAYIEAEFERFSGDL